MAKKLKVRKTVKSFVLLIILTAALVLPLNHVATAKKSPSRPITVISPFGPGGTDVELRNLAAYLQKYLGQPAVIKAMPNGGTTLGVSAAARSKPDGYTIVCNPVPTTILAQEFHGTDSEQKTFEYIHGWFEGPMDATVRAEAPYKTLADLIEASKKKPLKAALAGIGSIDHLHLLLLEKYTGLKAVTVPYAGGGPATAAVLRGDVDFFPGLSTTSVRFVRAGQLRQLVILGPKPLEALPDTPTIYQLGYKDYPNIAFIRGVSVRPGVPKDRIKMLEAAFKKAVDDQAFRAIMKKQGRPVTPFTGEELKKHAWQSLELARQYMPMMKAAVREK